ncbi:hypothetical protein ACTXT7_012319 [Hymenolepis weldensis]
MKVCGHETKMAVPSHHSRIYPFTERTEYDRRLAAAQKSPMYVRALAEVESGKGGIIVRIKKRREDDCRVTNKLLMHLNKKVKFNVMEFEEGFNHTSRYPTMI